MGALPRYAKVALALTFLLLMGSLSPVQAGPNIPSISQTELDGGNQPPATPNDEPHSPDQVVQIMLPLIRVIGNQSPVRATDDSYQTIKDTELVVTAANGVLANDSSLESGPLRALLTSDVSNGVLDLNTDGAFGYTPDPGFNGQDSFTYRATDGSSTSETATVTITMTAANEAPLAVNDVYQTAEDTELVVDAANGILANDSDPEMDPLQTLLVDDASNGVLNLKADGSFNYMPGLDFNGQDSFTYRASDAISQSNLATVTLTVNAVNDATVATDDVYQTAEDTELVVDVANGILANDSDPDLDSLQALLVDDASNGVLNLKADGSFNYMPAPDFNGRDSFTYRASDAISQSNLATVTLTVNVVNDAPVATDDVYQTAEDTELVVDVANGILANDSDPEMEPLQTVLVSSVSDGVLNLNENGSFDYTPVPDFNGQDSFTYRASDTVLESNLATVTITVDVNNAPQIVTGEIAFTKQIIDSTINEVHAAVAADLDGDGDMDIAATETGGQSVFWYENDGNGHFTKWLLDGNLLGVYPASVGDVDSDGDADVLAAGYSADTFVWYRNDGGGNFVRKDVDTASDGAHSIVTADMDDDGDTDLVTSSQDANTIAWYENDGAENFTLHIIDTSSLEAKRAEVADMDGDGDLDIVTASTADHEVNWFENDGNQNFTKRLIKKWVIGAYYASPADVDGDGDMDVFSASQWDHMIAWHRNDGGGLFTIQIMDSNAEGARTVIPADIDGDGDVDAVAASVNDDTVAWYKNDGSGAFTQQVIDQATDGAYGVFTVDMDFDGDVDVLATGRDDDTVALHTQIRAHTATVGMGGSLAIDSTLLLTTDADDGPASLTYMITEAPQFGELRVNGAPITSGGAFTQDDINNNRLTYVHDGANGSADEFTFTVADGGENGVQPATGSFSINITG